MIMSQRVWQISLAACVIGVLTLGIGQTRAAQIMGPAKDVPELQVLNSYVGTWEVVMATSDAPNAVIGKGKSSTKWILDGRFLEQSGTMLMTEGNTSIKVTTLMTFDVGTKTYRSWTFSSNGQATESEAKWDPATQTMTSTSCPNPKSHKVVTVANFAEAGIEKWKMTITDESGQLVRNLIGKNTRQKE